MNCMEKQKLVALLLDSIAGHIGFDTVMREIAKLEGIKSDNLVASACHELRHFYTDADLRDRDLDYDALMKKRLMQFVDPIRKQA